MSVHRAEAAAGVVLGANTLEPELVRRARGGDSAAFEEIVCTHAPATYRIVAGHLGDDEAEDAVQEVFIRVHQGLRGFRGHSRLHTWIYRIATNVALTRLRQRGNRIRRVQLLGDSEPEARPANPGRKLEQAEDRRAVHAALDRLPDHQRSVVVLRGLEGLPFAEVARILKIRRSTAESRMARAKKTLQTLLQPLSEAK